MNNTRILAYEVSKKLDERDLENISAALKHTAATITGVFPQKHDVSPIWDA